MKGLVITYKGIEETAAIEIKELIKAHCIIEEGCIIFDFKKLSELFLLYFKSQSADRIMLLSGSFQFEERKDLFNKLGIFINKDISKNRFFQIPMNFKVECIRIGKHDFKSFGVEDKSREFIAQNTTHNITQKTYSDIPDNTTDIVYLIYIIENKCYIGIDFVGFDLYKRKYKVFAHPDSLRATIAYTLVRESGFRKNDIMVDPFLRDGVLAIEAAIYSFRYSFRLVKTPKIHCFTKSIKWLENSKKNATYAGVESMINFNKIEIDRMELKFDEESVDRIITYPLISKRLPLEDIYNEFFYQSFHILKKRGTLALICSNADILKKYSSRHNFVLTKQKYITIGSRLLNILVFKKNANL